MQKVLYCRPAELDRPEVECIALQALLDEGYTVVSVTPQFCSISTGATFSFKAFGGFLVILERPETKL